MSFILDGYTFPHAELPARGPVVEVSPQRWAEQPLIGISSPGSVLTFLGYESQGWRFHPRVSEATKTKLLAVYAAQQEVLFQTPQNTTGFKVAMTELNFPYEEPVFGKYECDFKLIARAGVVGGTTLPPAVDDVVTIVRKTSDQIVNNSTVYRNDNELYFPVEANKFYIVKLFLFITSAHIDPDLKMRFASTGTTALTETVADSAFDTGTGREGVSVGGDGSRIDMSVDTYGFSMTQFFGATSAGQVSLQWAQYFASANDVTVLADSWLMWWEATLSNF